MVKPLVLTVNLGNNSAISGDLYLPSSSATNRLVILCHGFTAYRRYLFLPSLARSLAESGIAALSIDLPGTGTNGELGLIEDLNAFSTNTFRREEEGVRGLIKKIHHEGLNLKGKIYQFDNIFTFGHSRGGIAAIMGTHDTDGSLLAKATAVWASPSDLSPIRFGVTKEVEEAWRLSGEILYPVQRLGTELPLKTNILDDMLKNPLRLKETLSNNNLPLLVIHGSKDESIPVDCGKELSMWARDRSQLIEIPNTDHQFGASSQSGLASSELKKAISETVKFFTLLK